MCCFGPYLSALYQRATKAKYCDYTMTMSAHPAYQEISADSERDRASGHVFAVPFLSSDAARGHRRRDDGSFSLPSQLNWDACHEPHDL